MKKHSLIIIILVCIFLSAAYSQQKAEWKGTIEKENGVEIIKNPSEPLYGEITLNLEEDLSIGERKMRIICFTGLTALLLTNKETSML